MILGVFWASGENRVKTMLLIEVNKGTCCTSVRF